VANEGRRRDGEHRNCLGASLREKFGSKQEEWSWQSVGQVYKKMASLGSHLETFSIKLYSLNTKDSAVYQSSSSSPSYTSLPALSPSPVL
jgi:hypothetical protein